MARTQSKQFLGVGTSRRSDRFPAGPLRIGGGGPTLSQALAEAGLTQEDWDAYMDVLEGEDESAQRNWNCWMSNYLSGCTTCPTCPGPDPFGDVSGEN